MSDDYELVMRRTFKTSAEKLFRAWTEPELVSQWYSCGPDFSFSLKSWDARVGGRIAVDVIHKDGGTVEVKGEFLTVDPPRRLEYLWGDQRVLVELVDADGGTELVLRDFGAGDEMRQIVNEGWTHALGRLVAHSSALEMGS